MVRNPSSGENLVMVSLYEQPSPTKTLREGEGEGRGRGRGGEGRGRGISLSPAILGVLNQFVSQALTSKLG